MHSFLGTALQDTATALSTIAKMLQQKSRRANFNKAKCKQREDRKHKGRRDKEKQGLLLLRNKSVFSGCSGDIIVGGNSGSNLCQNCLLVPVRRPERSGHLKHLKNRTTMINKGTNLHQKTQLSGKLLHEPTFCVDHLRSVWTPSQLQRVAMNSRRPCCSTLTSACGMKMSQKKLC